MCKAGRLSIYGERYIIPLLLFRPALSLGGVSLPLEMPGRPTLAAAWALIRQPDPQRSSQKNTGVLPVPKKKQKKKKKNNQDWI